MIIMLNGPFGVGKTSVANALLRLIPHAMLYDPEIIGAALRSLTQGVRTPAEDTDDFQDIALWPTLTGVVAAHLHERYGRHLIVPMTIANPTYLDPIKHALAVLDPPLYQFCLVAQPATIQARLHSRGDGGTSWPWRKSQMYLPVFSDLRYGLQIDTENRTPAEVADAILKLCGVGL